MVRGLRISFYFIFWGVLEAPLTARVRVCILRNSKIYRTRTENNTRKFFFTSLSLFSPFYTLKQSTSPRVHGTFRNASAENFFKLLLFLAFFCYHSHGSRRAAISARMAQCRRLKSVLQFTSTSARGLIEEKTVERRTKISRHDIRKRSYSIDSTVLTDTKKNIPSKAVQC